MPSSLRALTLTVPPLGRILDGVGHQVVQGLADPERVHVRPQRRRNVHGERDVGGIGLGLGGPEAGLDQAGEVSSPRMDGQDS